MQDRPIAQKNLTSIIIITYNKFDYNRLCIESIRQFTDPGSYELLVIDNHSTDETVEWLRRQQDIHCVFNSANTGFPAACNQGIAIARGDSVLLLNNDTIVTPGWLNNLRRCLFSQPEIGAAGAITNSCSNFQSIPCDYADREEMLRFAAAINKPNPDRWENRGRLVGFCMLIKRTVIDTVGLFDETFSPGNYEDDDYSLRIRRAGYRLLLCRDCFIHHFGSVSFSGFGEKAAAFNRLLETNKQKFIDKWDINPHTIPTSDPIEDDNLKKWFSYQHEFNYYRQLVEIAGRKFHAKLEQANFALLSGDQEKALRLIMQAADFAHHSHPGFYRSCKLERMLRQIAGRLPVQSGSFPVMPAKGKRRILHVLSQGYASGSHTRNLERWIKSDPDSVHSVIITVNSTTSPSWLAAAALPSGGWYYPLDKAGFTFVQRAALLRDVSRQQADLVVLHIHPHDPIAAAAFGINGGPPVVFVNHADQAFNIGISTADLVVDHRMPGIGLTQSRRQPAACFFLPCATVPLPADRQTARQCLQIGQDQLTVLTIARGYQLTACGSYNFPKLLGDLSDRYPQALFLVAGAPAGGELAQLAAASNGRIRILPLDGNATDLYNAADIYLDALPLGANEDTAAAAAMALPVTGLVTEPAPQLAGNIVPGITTHFCSRHELAAAIDKLVADAGWRTLQGRCLQDTLLRAADWRQQLPQLYALVPEVHRLQEPEPERQDCFPPGDVIWFLLQQQSGLSQFSFL
ncbi:MAG: glycosyltransferase [Sporomusaceae bacterium]|nr:glycosyltransferase [Sporomusaceae bacterium]